MSIQIAKDQSYSSELSKETAYVMAYKPDFSLKRAIGVDVLLSDIFTAEKISASNKIIEIGRNCFFMDAGDEINKVSAQISSDNADTTKVLSAVSMIAANLKGEAEIYGFTLIQKICALVTEACDGRQKPDAKLALIRDLTQALASTLKKKIKDDGGGEGKILLADLSRQSSINNSNP